AAELGELVDGGGGRGRQAPAPDEPRALHRLQPRREEVCRDPRETVEQVGIALGPDEELAHDEQRPALADDVEGAGDHAVLVIAAAGHGTLNGMASLHLIFRLDYLIFI